MMPRYLICVVLILLTCRSVEATQGDPIAVRKWPGGVVSLETHWGLRLAIKTTDDAVDDTPAAAADQTISTSGSYDHVLSRTPNAPSPSWLPVADAKTLADAKITDPNQIRVRSTDNGVIMIAVDGIVVVVVDSDAADTNTDADDQVDVLVVATASGTTPTQASVEKWSRQWRPRFVIPFGFDPSTEVVRTLLDAGLAKNQIVRRSHNTFAVSHTDQQVSQPQVVMLSDTPWTMPKELASEFAKMEQASSESQKVFAKLSVQQMNFKPENGTHTPRWNAEHMMGRQLLFFSQIYHAIDPTIPTLDLNPKQMPPDYEFAHPDWDGAEEARQMQRVSDFTRRFAYLLDGMELDAKAPGSRWPTLRALLKQMQRHYGEHTSNTEAKFELPGFPQ
ncbi:putative secreted protein [Rhodopirellula maiorica SM1]|uniref:Putative secreted protein n=1 Tax=Rhodopirellula maiorica SM1 TaxID=1265738 RepID=M5S1I0_9BACT|nr:DinB family protein [Rhodopirellula maiorica]EMI21517.1 putative secreted protein [Rhodopirellula maiorica SM1]